MSTVVHFTVIVDPAAKVELAVGSVMLMAAAKESKSIAKTVKQILERILIKDMNE